MTTQLTKAEKKIRKAVYAVHIGVNTLSTNGCYDVARARRRAASYQYWIAKK